MCDCIVVTKRHPKMFARMFQAERQDSRASLSLTLFSFLLLNSLYNVASQTTNNDMTLHKDGDFIIEALLPITGSEGDLLDTYAIASEVVRLTIDDVNKNASILGDVDLGYQIVDDKRDLNLIMKRAFGIVSKYRPNSVCREDDEFCTADQYSAPFINQHVGAVIGPATSSSSVPSASLLGLYSIPQIGYTASSSVLSDKSRFKSFLRTIPSDDHQAAAIASFVKHFDWNYVFFVGSDDEYGRQGLASFKEAARKLKVCTADDVNIPFQRQIDAAKEIEELVMNMKKLPRVSVVVLFMFESDAAQILQEAEKEGLRNVTWILSDAIGATIVNYNITKEQLNGAFGIDFEYAKIPRVENHILNLTVDTTDNPWMLRLFEKSLQCSSKGVAGKRPCEKDEKLDSDILNLSGRWSRLINIVNSVKAIAYGLDNLRKCKGRLANGVCPNISLPISGKDLYAYIKNASFLGPLGQEVSFDENGDLDTKRYTFRNVIYDSQKDSLQFKSVAKWSSSNPPDQLKFLDGVDLTWSTGVKPSSTCSQACKPGQKQVGQSDCCWACHPCPKGEISNQTGAMACYKCKEGWYANEEQTECLETKIDYIQANDAVSIVIITISCIFLVAIVVVAYLFYNARDTPLIQDSKPMLLGLLLFATALGFVYAIFQVSLYRTDSACRFLSAFLLFVLLFAASTLLVMTTACDSLLTKFASHYLKPAAQYAAIILIGALLLFQILLVGVWFLTDTPLVIYMESSQALHIRECKNVWQAGAFIATGFPLLVLFLATAFAFKERDVRKNHHEAKYRSFCTMSICIILIAFFPTYRFAQGITNSIVIATTALVGSVAICACVILPKVYILVVQPERNLPEEERERSHNTTSSAHTAGSQHQPVFSETGEEPRLPSDVDFMTPQLGGKENHVVKDVPVI